MNHKIISNIILMSIFTLTISNFAVLSDDYKNNDSKFIFSFMKPVYAQSAPSDNSTDLGPPSDNPLADLGLSNSTNSTSVTNPATVSNSTTSVANSGSPQNQTSGATTPEFGNIASIILLISIVSIVVISARNRLGFN